MRNDCIVGKLSERNEAGDEEAICRHNWSCMSGVGVAQPWLELYVQSWKWTVPLQALGLLRDLLVQHSASVWNLFLSVLFIIKMKCIDCHLDFPLFEDSQCAKCASHVSKSNIEIKQLMVCSWSAWCFMCCSYRLFIYFRLYHSAIPAG